MKNQGPKTEPMPVEHISSEDNDTEQEKLRAIIKKYSCQSRIYPEKEWGYLDAE